MVDSVVVFTDRDGDTLSVTPRNNSEGAYASDPIITVTRVKNSQSVVFVENEVPDIIADLVDGLNLDEPTLYCVIGKIQDLIDQKEQLRIG